MRHHCYRVTEPVRRLSLLMKDPRDHDVLPPLPEIPVPSHLVPSDNESTVRAIRESGLERVEGYRQSGDFARLLAREELRGMVKRFGPDEVQCWLTESRVNVP
jgi:hypothetical protein